MTPPRCLPTDPSRLASHLGATTFGGPRWWTTAEIAAHHGYTQAHVSRVIARRGYAADCPRRRGRRGRIEIWCREPPPLPPDPRRGRDPDGARAALIQAVRARGGPPGRGRWGRGRDFWTEIAAELGRSVMAVRSQWYEAVRLGEVER